MFKTASVLADELDKLAEQLESAAAEPDTNTPGDYLSGIVQGLGLDGKASGV
jgi:hypothetical protein